MPPSPNGWHNKGHWPNEETMKQYINKIILPFITERPYNCLQPLCLNLLGQNAWAQYETALPQRI